ncbi:MAG: LCP family protein [Erysipelotrichaceae bacterium]|nr:LCP family protein [Erysipelotrichaceae bacterium]
MKKLVSALISRKFLFVMTLIAEIFFGYVVYQLQILPTKYFIPMVVILVLICLLMYIGQNDPDDEHLFRVSFVKLVNVLLAIALAFGSLTAMKGSSFLSSITSASTQTIEMNVAVLKSSTYQSLEDLAGCDFGGNEQDSVNVNKTEAMIEDEIGDITVTTYSSYTKLVSALEDEEVPAIIIKAVDIESLDDIDSSFSDKINIIATFTITVATVSANSANVTSETFNIFICGTDKTGSIDTFGLSDVNMIATVNPTTKQILLISIPRDYYVEIIGMDNVTGYDKLTHSAKGGISCTMETLENLLDIEFNYYAKFNFTSFINVIDALGGTITIDVPQYDVVGNDEGYFTTKIGNYTIYPGENTFDAQEALAFVRERKAFVDGDTVRGQNQMLMLKAIIKKICSSSLITNMDEIFESLSDSFETNMSDKEILALINMQIDDGASWDIQTYHLTGTDIRTFELATVGNVSSVNPDGLYVTQPDEESIALVQSYIEALFNDEIIKLDDEDEEETDTDQGE